MLIVFQRGLQSLEHEGHGKANVMAELAILLDRSGGVAGKQKLDQPSLVGGEKGQVVLDRQFSLKVLDCLGTD